MRNGTVAAVRSSTNSLLAPPLKLSFALICQSVVGKPARVEVSSNLRRTVFAFALMVALPIDSVLVQSAPPQRPPAAETKSEKKVLGAVLKGGRTAVSRRLGGTTAPLRTLKDTDCEAAPPLRNSYLYKPSPPRFSTRSIGLLPAGKVSVTPRPSGRCSDRTTGWRSSEGCH